MIPPWLEIAQHELLAGVSEIAGPGDSQRIVEYHQTTTLRATDDEVPWCSSFVNWCVQKAGLDPTKSARARSWLFWGKRLQVPPYGCIVVLNRANGPQDPSVLEAPGHVGFYLGPASQELILVLGGNQSNAVNVKRYAKNRVLGYQWPG